MAETPKSINITIDEDALRAQVHKVVNQAMEELSMTLFRMSWEAAPEFRQKLLDDQERFLREKWGREREREGVARD